jgi:glycosyltransferase involved in cell wall biosynthesis
VEVKIEMNRKVKVSILMAVYNTDFLLVKRAIDSVLSQDFHDFELIIIDDGSANFDRNLIAQYAEKHEDKIVYVRHRNRGQSLSISRGVVNSVGEFITIIDADDAYKPQHLQLCLEEMQEHDLIASTTETIVDSEEDYYVPDKNDHTKVIHVDDCILFATLFGRREVFTTLKFKGGFAADADFFERAKLQFRTQKVNHRTYIYYRNMPNSICSTLKKQQTPHLS